MKSEGTASIPALTATATLAVCLNEDQSKPTYINGLKVLPKPFARGANDFCVTSAKWPLIMQVLLASVFNAIRIVIFIVRKSRVPHSVALPDYETDCRFATVATVWLDLHPCGWRVLGLIKGGRILIC